MRLLIVAAVILSADLSSAVLPTRAELVRAQEWAAARFEGAPPANNSRAGEMVVRANHDPVQKNSRSGRPLNVAGHQFTRGLYCHAESEILVTLPGPADKFLATVGIDSNEQTSGGRGSVEFKVLANGAVGYQSGVVHEGGEPRNLDVALHGAREFTLRIEPTPDGISCDQADWADGRVTMQDGTTLWLAELPMRDEHHAAAFSTSVPFCFKYGEAWSTDFLANEPNATNGWPLTRSSERKGAEVVARREITSKWLEPKTGLEITMVSVVYDAFPTVEWTVYFKNTASTDSPLISEIQAIDADLVTAPTDPVLHHNVGSVCQANDYEPRTSTLSPGKTEHFAPRAGRSTDPVMPYFNLDGHGEGAIVAIGWPGQWKADFKRTAAGPVRLRAGQEVAHFRLKPGEEVRTPLIALQFYSGDWIRAQNIWRRWMLVCNLPKPGGEPLRPQMAACSSHQFGEMIHANTENQKLFVQRYLDEKLPLDYWWMDAGWYIYDPKYSPAGWPNTGTWEVDTNRFPRGLREITDYAHARSVKSIVWFEPERVAPGTWLYREHPDWLLGKDGEKLLNLGNAEALKWLIEHTDKTIKEQGIDLYRQDFNIDPLSFWQATDSPERQGITENHHVTGYLRFWDELRHRHPKMLIDSCASGGRRNDLETLRRAVPLLRSDYIIEPVGQQNHTYGLAPWIPFFGTGTGEMDVYKFRSQMCPHFTACFDMRRNDLPFDRARTLLKQWKEEIAPNYLGDYYPLSSYAASDDVWMAWQFDRPEQTTGVVQAFRRAESDYESARYKLHGLEEKARYAVTDLDSPDEPKTYTGSELMETGLLITLAKQPAAAVITYRRL